MGHLIAKCSQIRKRVGEEQNRAKNSSAALPLELCHHTVKNPLFMGLDRKREKTSMERASVWSLVRLDWSLLLRLCLGFNQ